MVPSGGSSKKNGLAFPARACLEEAAVEIEDNAPEHLWNAKTVIDRREHVAAAGSRIAKLLACLATSKDDKIQRSVSGGPSHFRDDFPAAFKLLRWRGELLVAQGRHRDAVAALLEYAAFAGAVARDGSVTRHIKGWAHLAEAGRLITSVAGKLEREVASNAIATLRSSREALSTPSAVVAHAVATSGGNDREAAEAVDYLQNVRNRCATSLSIAMGALAIRVYELKHGGYPDAIAPLEDIADAKLKDAWTGESLVYRATDANWWLYSCGDDGIDDTNGKLELLGDDYGHIYNMQSAE